MSSKSFNNKLAPPATDVMDIYAWPIEVPDDPDETDARFYPWVAAVQNELAPVREEMYQPMPEDPALLDEYVTQWIDGWAPRVAALMVRSEWHLNKAKKTKWPAKAVGADGKANTEADRTAIYAEKLADFRFVRDELENMLIRMVDRTRWAQSARKVHADAQ